MQQITEKESDVAEAAEAQIPPVHRMGPQRNPQIDQAVLAATRELLVERGYQGTTVDAIAARAGVGRPTVYRRWRSKAHIVHDAIYPSVEADLPDAPIADQLRVLVHGAYALFGSEVARAGIPGLMAETHSDPELRERLVTEQLDPFTTALEQLLSRARADGLVRPDIDVDSVVDLIAGAAIFALGIRGADDQVERATQMGALLLDGLLTPGV